MSHPKEEKQVIYEPRHLPVASKKEVKSLKKKQVTKGSKQAFLLYEENPQPYCALKSFLKVNRLLSNCPLICGWDFRVSTKIEGKKNSYLVQVVASVLLFLSLFLSLVPFEETNLSPSLRNEGMVPVWRSQTQCTSVYFAQNPGTAQAPLRIRFAFVSVPWLWQPVLACHTWTPVPWRSSIWALIVCMLLIIFFWWPTSEIPKLITSLEDRTAHQSGDSSWTQGHQLYINRQHDHVNDVWWTQVKD